VTVDIAVLGRRAGEWAVLLIERRHEPFQGAWALPGGFVDENEALEAAAHRELREETGLEGLCLRQVGAFGDPGRDPRGHTVSVAYVAEVDADEVTVAAGDDAARAVWYPCSALGLDAAPEEPRAVPLAFDHASVLRAAIAKLGTS
jgi:8-oxo-dGTP diphosphatase